MDPSNTQPQGGASNLDKLEKDLESLTKEASTQSGVAPAPVQTPPPAPDVAPAPMTTPAVVPATSVSVESSQPEGQGGKKSSPLLVVALVLMVVALVAAIAYVVGMKFFASAPTPAPTARVVSTPISIPTLGPVATASASPVASGSASPKASASVKPSGSATPSAAPGL